MNKNNNYYLSVGDYGYITSKDSKLFYYYLFDRNGIVISFNVSNENSNNIYVTLESIIDIYSKKIYKDGLRIISEVLFFLGKKIKNIIFICNILSVSDLLLEMDFVPCKNQYEYIKEAISFLSERKKKYKSIKDLCKYPHLVPWNLVPCEIDVLNILAEFVKSPSTTKILEIGSGFGKNLSYIRESGYSKAIGIEYVKSAYSKSLKLPYIKDSVFHGDITRTIFSNENFDVVLDIGCIHCLSVKSRKKALCEINRIIKKNGIIISRCFKPKDKKWLNEYPILTNKFGLDKDEYLDIFRLFFKNIRIIESHEYDCYYFIGSI